ncbi:lipid-A-disaccharide kinase [Pseudofulvimonas gallinarii]|uniref:Tetraacyldisaccharide 4'-kinase n=2 Tax=Pseudofulvimonas gallinarii TaxID=634155 RepID=A0A4R3KZT4_9GAMM|nr:lipid-A-disaccharide kinase [Pseudofulvimonas gallinarii]
MSNWRARATHWLEQRWYGAVPPNMVLRGLAMLFERVARSRRADFLSDKRRAQRVGVPVIVVGNLAVGGAGKTPLTIALVHALSSRGFRPGVISRGYGRAGIRPHRVSVDDDAHVAGDEPLLIARRTGVPVAVAAKRIDAARLLLQSDDIDVLIADDGMQHYALARDIEILAVDGRRRFGNGHLLPAGPLREPIERAAACDFIVVNGGRAAPDEVAMQLELMSAVALASDESIPLESFAGRAVHAVAGIAEPDRFFDALRVRGLRIEAHGFSDHHAFTPADLEFGDEFPVLMTEKDAVKCVSFARGHWYAVPVSAQLPDAFFDAVSARLADLKGNT